MKNVIAALIAPLVLAAFHSSAAAWASADRYAGGYRGAEGTNAYGGSMPRDWYGGANYAGANYRGTTTGTYAAGAVRTSPDSYRTYRPPPYGVPGYAPYHQPYPVYSSGCYNCGGAVAAGMIVGAAAGAAVASNNAYAAGVAAGAGYAIGANYATPPAGAGMISQGGNTYYLSGSTWFKAVYGANGLYYTVVPAP